MPDTIPAAPTLLDQRQNPLGGGQPRAYDMLAAPWVEAGRTGLKQKRVRADGAAGLYLGLIGFEPLARSGLHQHLGTALSYFLDGSLMDYGGPAQKGDAGINLAGATHDAIAYGACLLASRLEGPVLYAPEDSATGHELHSGARHAAFANPDPQAPPELNIAVEALPALATGIPGLSRRAIFDYAGTATPGQRFCQFSLLPGARIPAHRVSALTEWYLLAGDLALQGGPVLARTGSFLVMEPGTEVALESRFGARVLAWAEGPVAWADGPRPDLYGA
jgi:hypothetical protein